MPEHRRKRRFFAELQLDQFLHDAVDADLVLFVDRDEGPFERLVGNTKTRDNSSQDATVVDADRASIRPGEAESLECCSCRRDEFDLGERTSLTDDVDVALDELAEATLLRTLRTPDRSDLDGPEHFRQFGPMSRIEACEGNGQVEAQSEVSEFEGVPGVRCLLERFLLQVAFHDRERQFLVVAAEAGVKSCAVLDDGCFDLIEAVLTKSASNHRQHMLAPGLVRRKKVTHSAGRVHLACHGSSVADRYPTIVSGSNASMRSRCLAIVASKAAVALSASPFST